MIEDASPIDIHWSAASSKLAQGRTVNFAASHVTIADALDILLLPLGLIWEYHQTPPRITVGTKNQLAEGVLDRELRLLAERRLRRALSPQPYQIFIRQSVARSVHYVDLCMVVRMKKLIA